ncbi:MAG TPA: DUF551 domain-containing protein [Sphingobacteriaceae bacterium]|nr:DUF551 domain-containing protein [Sphingobacteriaceae bacterium]
MKWISILEKLPPEHAPFLGIDCSMHESKDIEIMWWDSTEKKAYSIKEAITLDCDGEEVEREAYNYYNFIDYWMPLPALPPGKEQIEKK